MATIKFHEKNVAAYGKIEATEDVYNTPAATDVLPATSMEGSITIETGSYQYLGSDLSREEYTYEKDSYAEFTLETPQQVLNNLDPARAVTDVPMQAWLRACGGSTTVDGGTGVVTITNSAVENSSLSIAYRKTSSQDTVNQKLLKFTAVRGMVDVNATINELPKLKFTLKGNASVPEQNALVTPDFGNQTTYVAATVRPSTIILAEITPYGENFNTRSTIAGAPSIAAVGTLATVTLTAHGLTTGKKVNITGCTGTDGAFYNGNFIITRVDADHFTYVMQGSPSLAAAGAPTVKKDGWKKTFCFGNLVANNFFGFDFSRFVTGCEQGFAKEAIPTDVSVSLLEGIANKYTISTITNVTNTATATSNSHGLTAGDSVTISGVSGNDGTLYNGTFLVDTTPTADTFTYKMSGTPTGNAAGSPIFINNTQAIFNPEVEIQNFFAIQLKFGTQAGRYVTYSWSKVQLANYKDGKIGKYFAKDCTFRNTGTSSIILS